VQWLLRGIYADIDNISPRAGVAWSPDGQKTVLRAPGGIYYDRIPLRAVSNALQRDGVRYGVAVLPFGRPEAPEFPQRMAAFPEGLVTAITAIDLHIQSASSVQASWQVERDLGPAGAAQVGYQYLRGTHLILSRNVNAPRPGAGRPDPRFGNVSRYESSGYSYYHAATASWHWNRGRWGSLRTSYTFSKAIDNAGNFFFSSPQDNFNLRAERGLSDNDQRHRLAVSGSFEAAGFRLSTVYSYNSALPFNVLTGTDRNGDTTINDRPEGVGRNTGRGFGYASLDVRLSRRVMLKEGWAAEFLVESFNTFNRANWMVPNQVFGPGMTPLASFGRATAAADPRQIQAGLKLDF
jgi:hypothetical protein